MAIGTVTMVRNRDVAYGLVLIWAFVGILIRQTSADGFAGRYPAIIAAVIASLVIYVAAEVAINRRRKAMTVLPKRQTVFLCGVGTTLRGTEGLPRVQSPSRMRRTPQRLAGVSSSQNDSLAYWSNRSGGSTVGRVCRLTAERTVCRPGRPMGTS